MTKVAVPSNAFFRADTEAEFHFEWPRSAPGQWILESPTDQTSPGVAAYSHGSMSEDLSIPAGFPVEEAMAAWGAVFDFWAALAADDDDATRRLLFPASMIRNGMTPEGLAGQLRELMGVSRDECRSMGVSTTVRVLGNGGWVYLSKPTWRFELFDEPTLVPALLWIVVRHEDGSWRMWGAPEPDDVALARLVQLPITPPAQGTA